MTQVASPFPLGEYQEMARTIKRGAETADTKPENTKLPDDDGADDLDEDDDETEQPRSAYAAGAPIVGRQDAVRITSVEVEGEPGQLKKRKRHDHAPHGGVYMVGGRRVNAYGKLVSETGRRIRPNGEEMTPEEELAEVRAGADQTTI